MINKIAIQGYRASFHDIAALKLFGKDSNRIYCDGFKETFKLLMDGKSDYAVCAIENSLYGSINEVYDLLISSPVQIVGEAFIRVEQCLIGLPGSAIKDISKVYSHPVALAQCEEYLDSHLAKVEREEYIDTAAGVELIKKLNNPSFAAIASREAAELHGMKILAESIESNKQNFTRFVALSREKTAIGKLDKASLVIKTGHTPGSLYNALGVFAKRSINLTKLQSRPVIGKAWHYMFYVDIELAKKDLVMDELLKELSSLGNEVVLLGQYPSSRPL